MIAKGMILAGGTGSRLWPSTKAVSKQLIPVYDKPMIYYPLSTALLAGMRDIGLIVSPQSISSFQQLLGDGSQLGIEITYLIQSEPRGLADAYLLAEDYLDGAASLLILGDNLFHGPGLGTQLSATAGRAGATVFGYQVSNPSDYGVVEFDALGNVVSIEEKPKAPKSKVAIPGLYFTDATASIRAQRLRPSARGELEITDLLQSYLDDGVLSISLLPRSTVWLDTGNAEAMAEASEYVRVLQKRQGQMVSSPEEIAWRQGLIDDNQLESLGKKLSKSAYGTYLLGLLGSSHA